MSATVSDFRARFPEFGDSTGDFPDARVTLALSDANLFINAGVWGSKADLGRLYLAAHNLSIEGEAFGGVSGGVGVVTQESVGDVSRAFAVPGVNLSETDRDLLWTKYGTVFLRLKRTLVSTPIIL